MWNPLRTSIVALAILTLVTGVVYPAVVTLLAQGIWNHQANGSLIEADGKTVGSIQVGQNFVSAKYFWGRLSATGSEPYNAAASSGTNYGPLHPGVVESARKRIDELKAIDPTMDKVPMDLITASGSGLDPHISLAAAYLQVKRVALVRKMSEEQVRKLIGESTVGRQFGFLGEPRVHVLQLNLALDRSDRQ